MTQVDPTHLAKRPDSVSFAVVVAHLFVVVSPVYVAAAVGPDWLLLGCWLFFGLSMNGALNLMHECSHYHLFKKKSWSDFLGKWVLAPLVFADFDAYRRRHWDHHRFVGVAGETKDTYLIDIQGWALLTLAVRCALMSEAVKKFVKQSGGETASGHRNLVWLLHLLTFQLIFALSLILAARTFHVSEAWVVACYRAAVAYTVVYLYGLMSLTVFMASLRAIAEHQQNNDDAAVSGYAALRNFTCTPLSRYLMGAYGFGEHYTHHRVPSIPYYHLQVATRTLAETDRSLQPARGYFSVLAAIVTR